MSGLIHKLSRLSFNRVDYLVQDLTLERQIDWLGNKVYSPMTQDDAATNFQTYDIHLLEVDYSIRLRNPIAKADSSH